MRESTEVQAANEGEAAILAADKVRVRVRECVRVCVRVCVCVRGEEGGRRGRGRKDRKNRAGDGDGDGDGDGERPMEEIIFCNTKTQKQTEKKTSERDAEI
jgi:hypothetical protein